MLIRWKSKNSNCSWFSVGNSNEVIHSAITESECLSASSYKIKTDGTGEHDTDNNIQGNAILNIELLEEAIQRSSSCKNCHGLMEITENISQRCGWAQSFNLTCVNPECDATQVQFESSTSHGHKQFKINDKCVLGFCSIGKGHTHAEKFSAVMDLPPPLTHKSFANITHKIEKVSEQVVQVELKRAAAITKEIVSNTDWYSDSINENRNKS